MMDDARIDLETMAIFTRNVNRLSKRPLPFFRWCVFVIKNRTRSSLILISYAKRKDGDKKKNYCSVELCLVVSISQEKNV